MSLPSMMSFHSFQNHIPARGRKPESPSLNDSAVLNISKPYPRKGTETSSRDNPPLSVSYFKTISPQGDGNPATKMLIVWGVAFNFKTISPQGDGAYLQPPLPERRRWHTQCAGGGAMDASRKLSIATEVHARHKRPHRLACSPLPP